jgi:3,4-dihydroxyphenylacetate 2,3-dioxygenase
MGDIVGAAIFGHQPGIMAPEPMRKAMGGGRDTTLVDPGMARLRHALDAARADTLVIFDTHWFTTVEHIAAGAARFQGIYTSEELPLLITDHAYDYPGAPALAEALAEVTGERGVRFVNATNPHITVHYPTLNALHYLHRGEAVLSIGVCQTAEAHNYLDLGACLSEAVRRTPDARVALVGSGGMSHTFWPMDTILDHASFRPEDVVSPEARAIDERILAYWRDGDHAAVVDLYPEYRRFHPEGFFGHYLMLVGALGGRACRARGRQLSEYENAVGTGQVHVWFDVAA